jgi:hypothetical protein
MCLGRRFASDAVVMTTRTLVLLGDSILDNAPYTRPHPDTTARLRELLPEWKIELAAQDGATMSGVQHQLRSLDGTASIAVLSVGGNDVLQHVGLLEQRSTSSARLLEELLEIAEEFEQRYERVAQSVAARAERTILCTIYEAPLEPAAYARLARVPLALLNDRIVRVASRLSLDVLELRTVCTESADFVRQIEPSARGAEKIARAIAGINGAPGAVTSGRVFSGVTRRRTGDAGSAAATP